MSDFPVVLKLEQIGDDQYWAKSKGASGSQFRNRGPYRPPSYVAVLVWDGYAIEKRPQRGQRDYSQANSVGSRGIYTYHLLYPDHCYEVNERITWQRSRLYWCRVENGQIIEMTYEEALQWLSTPSA